MKILLVEDNMADALLCKTMLEDYMKVPFIIKHVNYLGAAVNEVRNEINDPYDIILLDLNLNDSKGISTLKVFKSYCGNLPIVIFSGLLDTKIVSDAIIYGAEKFLVKGNFSPKFLAEELMSIIDTNNKKKILGVA